MLLNISRRTGIITIACTLPILYYFAFVSRLRSSGTPHRPWDSWPTLSKQSFAERWLATDLLPPFDHDAVRAYCSATETWRTNVVLNLPDANGGVGNVKAWILDYILYAIETGSAMTLPGMVKRDANNLKEIWNGKTADLSHMFDQENFLKIMAEDCPQLKIYKPDEIPADIAKGPEYVARTRRQDTGPTNSRYALREHLDKWLHTNNISNTTSTQVDTRRTMWEVDTLSVPPGVRSSFGRLLRVNPSIAHFAGRVMENLAANFGLHIRPTDGLHQNAFYGAHLRTEEDAVKTGWLNDMSESEYSLDWDAQTDQLLGHMQAAGLHVMYLASGNSSDKDSLAAKAATEAPGIVVLSKWDLLSEEEGRALGALQWDQQGLVDLMVLQRCSLFGGYGKSSFSYMTVIARQTYLESKALPLGKAWYSREVEPHVPYEDSLSRMVGRNRFNEEHGPRGCWPG